ncbi:hypothetical protein GCM10025865_01930 [Paraoerskovia sediminicola]|uniref:Glycosyl transferase family 2 n=1 Tax=Paraoerskovia sediminicola TaxID=1138587 RepID=A0ABN6X859_9CELL|nr:hypothetical protein [Paraoerskovia sediminicola]BDZ40894.1 hypothetical protein GCM10025865_01930 [Paraoerskovia sediminicola]
MRNPTGSGRPLVSVVVTRGTFTPTAPWSLREALGLSVTRDTRGTRDRTLRRVAESDLELVLVDDGLADVAPSALDGSDLTDTTAMTGTTGIAGAAGMAGAADLADLARSGAAVATVCHARPGDVGGARTAGAQAARGRFVTFLEPGVVFAPGHLDALVRAMESLGCDYARSASTLPRTMRLPTLARGPHQGVDTLLDPRSSMLASPETALDPDPVWTGLYDRSLADDGLLDFPEGVAGDRAWAARLALRSRTWALVTTPGATGPRATLSPAQDLWSMSRTLDVVLADRRGAPHLGAITETIVERAAQHLDRAGDTLLGGTRSPHRAYLAAARREQRDLHEQARALLAAVPGRALTQALGAAPEGLRRSLAPVLPRSPIGVFPTRSVRRTIESAPRTTRSPFAASLVRRPA